MATSDRFSSFHEGDIPLISLITREYREDEVKNATAARSQESQTESEADVLQAHARKVRATWEATPSRQHSLVLASKWKAANRAISDACRFVLKPSAKKVKPAPALERLADHSALLYQALSETKAALRQLAELPRVVVRGSEEVPRIYAAVSSFLQVSRGGIHAPHMLAFLEAIQSEEAFTNAELSSLRFCFELAIVERIGLLAESLVSSPQSSSELSEESTLELLRSLGRLTKLDWKAVFDALSRTDHILRQDPAGAYGLMDIATRERYHAAVTRLAENSSWSESEVAQAAVQLASAPQEIADPRARERRSHVGFYLLDSGQQAIKSASGYREPFGERIRNAVRAWPTTFYLSTIALSTLAILAAVFAGSHASGTSLHHVIFVLLIAFIPVTECAITLTNLLVTHLVSPERMPRLDFSSGVPRECSTLVAIPILLASEKQVRQAVRDLEIRYLGNRDRNVHFALVTDPPDSLHRFDEKDDLAGLCSLLIEELQEKYARRHAGSFIHLHRHRAYNSTEGIWMGWERKRGKMLDLNNLLLNGTDRFPVKAGNLEVLKTIRYVITLDQDTQLLTGSARELIGALAHPLNRAVIDPITSRVVEGYAILQPRVAISVKAAKRSRLAAIYSGDANFDIYTRAVSDVYQDLFGAGIYTGKGIYEVETFQRILEYRFPNNTILSHDLIEGAHARTGFISDVEVVDDYPSHVSAYSRRKHRWVRGDWQIILWLFPRVPGGSGKLVPNPLSVISRWQIFDNLRRSLTEIATFALLLCGWLAWPQQALFWTLTALFLAASPICLDFFVSLIAAGRNLFTISFWKSAASDLAGRSSILLCRIALLCHQSLIALDAVVRTAVRMVFTHQRLLEWETAAQAELGANRSKNPVEKYINWTAPVAIALTAIIARFAPSSLWIALPFLMLWGTSKVFCDWLSLPYPRSEGRISAAQQSLVRYMSLRTWRFFCDFCTAEENWLIPDVVQVEPPIVVHAASTTNLGLLLNAQLAAGDLGFITLPEFLAISERTMATMAKLPTYNGHFYNWYDSKTLEPRSPRFISTVDNGNLVCCLWTLKGACAELKSEPLFPGALRSGLTAYLDVLESGLPVDTRSESARAELHEIRRRLELPERLNSEWIKAVQAAVPLLDQFKRELTSWAPECESNGWARALSNHLLAIEKMARDFAPWCLPEFAELRAGSMHPGLPKLRNLTLEIAPAVLTALQAQLVAKLDRPEMNSDARPLAMRFAEALSHSLESCHKTLARLHDLGATADRLAQDQDFSFFYSPEKELLSIGYDADNHRLWDYHYDLLASEARAAVFVGISKGEVPQQVWFRMLRTMARVNDRSTLLSWTGTMFEYLMPAMWMKFFPNTLLERAAQTAVLGQRNHAKDKFIPWGFSECSCADKGPDGRYNYRAVGVPALALSRINADDLVVSPYSAFLALMTDGPASATNLLDMHYRGWLTRYGFYDAYDFSGYRPEDGSVCEVVACWMAHHQGMILVAAANALGANLMQRRFHSEPMVRATERLLQEAPRSAADPISDEPGKMDWLKTSIPVVRNLWQSALSAQGQVADLPVAHRMHETDV